MKVCKFGGSSLANSQCIKNVASIIVEDPERKYIVVSAPGKDSRNNEKITDLLFRYAYGEDTSDKIKNIFNGIASDLNIDIDLASEYYRIFRIPHSIDYIVSRGEYLCAKIVASYIGYSFIDSSNLIIFNEKGIDEEKTSYAISVMSRFHSHAVIGGFYGSYLGEIKVFERGGSDITGAIIAQKTGADVYENWSDVDGVMSADPRIVNNPHIIKEITYRELRELCCMGATILHEDAIIPVRRAKIPLNIRNTMNPKFEGTMIVNSRERHYPYGIIGITGCGDGRICIVSENINAVLNQITDAINNEYISMDKPDNDTVLFLQVEKEKTNSVINRIYNTFYMDIK